jgi:hypothetical protein
MKKNKPSKKKVNLELKAKLEQYINSLTNAVEKSLENLPSSNLLESDYGKLVRENPEVLVADPLGVFVDKVKPLLSEFFGIKKNITFNSFLSKLSDFLIRCKDLKLEAGTGRLTKAEVKESFETLETKIKEIETLLRMLIPLEVKRKKESIELRKFRSTSEFLVVIIDDLIVPKLRKYLKPTYKRDQWNEKKQDIQKFWEDTWDNKPFPKRLKIDDRTETTIAIGIVAYWFSCNRRKLYDIYSTTKRLVKKYPNPENIEHPLLQALFSSRIEEYEWIKMNIDKIISSLLPKDNN